MRLRDAQGQLADLEGPPGSPSRRVQTRGRVRAGTSSRIDDGLRAADAGTGTRSIRDVSIQALVSIRDSAASWPRSLYVRGEDGSAPSTTWSASRSPSSRSRRAHALRARLAWMTPAGALKTQPRRDLPGRRRRRRPAAHRDAPVGVEHRGRLPLLRRRPAARRGDVDRRQHRWRHDRDVDGRLPRGPAPTGSTGTGARRAARHRLRDVARGGPGDVAAADRPPARRRRPGDRPGPARLEWGPTGATPPGA